MELCKIPGIVSVLSGVRALGPSGVAGSGNSRAIEQAALVLNWICSERKK
ncbi:U-box domain-containing protein 8 [Panicum miliaceum]|uniref:U-box domain-containing protein 8 n=1 Tax=Panicum miliaceum TaxID=4540 RepID=A0A3L6T5J0_PANMI|nr:U-box domain-containing protein 8 [Panicum miliaceum]